VKKSRSNNNLSI